MARTQLDLSEANQALQNTLQRGEPRIAASYALVGAILLGGSAGYAADAWLGSWPWALMAGLAAGIGIGLVNLVASLRRV